MDKTGTLTQNQMTVQEVRGAGIPDEHAWHALLFGRRVCDVPAARCLLAVAAARCSAWAWAAAWWR